MKTTKILVMCMMLPCTILFVSARPAPLCGDVNGDGEVTNADVFVIIGYIQNYGTQPGWDPALADVNGDGEVQIIDALQVAQYCAGMITVLNCVQEEPPLRLEDIMAHPENYLGDGLVINLEILRLEPVTISDFYNNHEEGYAVFVRDEFNFESSFYIPAPDHAIFQALVGTSVTFSLSGSDGPYTESHIAMYPYLISVKTHPDYNGIWTVYLVLL